MGLLLFAVVSDRRGDLVYVALPPRRPAGRARRHIRAHPAGNGPDAVQGVDGPYLKAGQFGRPGAAEGDGHAAGGGRVQQDRPGDARQHAGIVAWRAKFVIPPPQDAGGRPLEHPASPGYQHGLVGACCHGSLAPPRQPVKVGTLDPRAGPCVRRRGKPQPDRAAGRGSGPDAELKPGSTAGQHELGARKPAALRGKPGRGGTHEFPRLPGLDAEQFGARRAEPPRVGLEGTHLPLGDQPGVDDPDLARSIRRLETVACSGPAQPRAGRHRPAPQDRTDTGSAAGRYARSGVAALISISSYSSAGEDSSTIAPPAPMLNVSPCRTAVLITMLRSAPPDRPK